MTDSADSASGAARHPIAFAMLLFAVAAAIRVAAPPDLAEGDQQKQLDYVVDVVRNGSRIVQHEANGAIATKPPLYNWLAAMPSLAMGPTLTAAKIPSLLAAALVVWVTATLAREAFGPAAAAGAAVALVLSSLFSRLLWFARTDMLLTATLVAALLAAWRVRRREGGAQPADAREPDGGGARRWRALFHGATAAGLLTKGPIGLLFPLLIAFAWHRRERERRELARALRPFAGSLVAIAVFLAWFAIAIVAEPGVWDSMVGSELLDRFRGPGSTKAHEVRPFWYYVPHLLARFAPWSLLALVGAFAWRRAERTERALIELAAVWIAGIVVVFSFVPAKRPERLFPISPAVALLAGWTLAQFESGRLSTFLRRAGGAIVALVHAGVIGIGVALAIGRAVPRTPFSTAIAIAAIASGMAGIVAVRRQRAIIPLAAAGLAALAAYQWIWRAVAS